MRNRTAAWEIRNDAARRAWLARGRTQLVYEVWQRGEGRALFNRRWERIACVWAPDSGWLKEFPLTPEVEEAAKTYMVD